uniref:Uncharacterized protein n=1 Tax=Arundo donax TaxID=35708 RepID=A0A0A9FFS2_ARUDO
MESWQTERSSVCCVSRCGARPPGFEPTAPHPRSYLASAAGRLAPWSFEKKWNPVLQVQSDFSRS